MGFEESISKDANVLSFDDREEAEAAHRLFAAQSGKSDHLMIVDAFHGWLEAKTNGPSAEREYCDKHFISLQSMQTISAGREDYADVLADLGFVPSNYNRWLRELSRTGGVRDSGHAHLNAYSKNKRVVKAVMTAGFYPNVVRVKHPETTYIQTAGGAMDKDANPKDLKMFTKEDGRVFLHAAFVLDGHRVASEGHEAPTEGLMGFEKGSAK